jgi:hypothetical protein
MRYLPLLAVLLLVVAGPSAAQAPPAEPKITLTAGGGSGTISVSGSIELPSPWKLSIHTLCVKYRRSSGGATLNWLIPVKGGKFQASMNFNAGSYAVWAVIDVKDNEGREKQIGSETKEATVS